MLENTEIIFCSIVRYFNSSDVFHFETLECFLMCFTDSVRNFVLRTKSDNNYRRLTVVQ